MSARVLEPLALYAKSIACVTIQAWVGLDCVNEIRNSIVILGWPTVTPIDASCECFRLKGDSGWGMSTPKQMQALHDKLTFNISCECGCTTAAGGDKAGLSPKYITQLAGAK